MGQSSFWPFQKNNLSNDDRQTPIVEYSQNLTSNASRKTKYRTLSYVIVGNELFKKYP